MSARLKALFVGINCRFVNPTNSLIPALVARFASVYVYGPGFVDAKTLEAGIERYLDSIGDVDLIVTTHACCGEYDADRLNTFVEKYVALLAPGQMNQRFMNDVAAYFRRNTQRVFCFVTEMDPHAVRQETLDALVRHAGYFVGWGEGHVRTLGDGEAVKNEQYLQKKRNMSLTLGLFDDFVTRYREKIVNLGHAVADNEFYWGTLANRRYDVAVPGASYARRSAVRAGIKTLGGIRVAGLRYRRVYQVADRLALRPYANFYLVHLYNLAFQRAMSRSKACVTEGGGNNYPVRKFFEIPAAGALMVCWPAVGLEALGFKDRVNCIFVRDAEQAMHTIQELVRDVEPFEEIAAAGRDLVLREHSIAARSAQLHQAITSIRAGAFRGSSWHDGHFRCVPHEIGAVQIA